MKKAAGHAKQGISGAQSASGIPFKGKNESSAAEIESLLKKLLGDEAGRKVMNEICKRYAGERVYIPRLTEAYRNYRDEEIRHRFKGDNFSEMKNVFGLGQTRILQIVKTKQ